MELTAAHRFQKFLKCRPERYAQVAVYLAYATDRGHVLMARELYLPASWTEDPPRMAAAAVPEDIGFATKPALATGMLTRALRAGVSARWVAGDEVYGADDPAHLKVTTAACRM